MAGMTIHPENPLKFDFIISTGDDDLEGEIFRKESEKLINYKEDSWNWLPVAQVRKSVKMILRT